MLHTETLTWKEILETKRVFDEIVPKNALAMKNFIQAIKNSNAENFVLAGRGTSNHALIYLKYLLEIYTPYSVSLAFPSVVTKYNGKVNYKNSVVIGCSRHRRDRDGAITLSITNDEQSPMAKAFKHHLFCNAELENSVAATKTFSAQLFVCAWITAELSRDERLFNTLLSLGSYVNEIINKIDRLTSALADKLKNMQNGFILSRGITYPIALESALKLQETCYVQVKGYASSDFYHGPMAMVNENTPIIIYCPTTDNVKFNDNILKDQIESIDKMIELRAPVYVVTTDKYVFDTYSKKTDVFYIPQTDENTSVFAFAIFAQMLACKISCAIGNNPDSPRALKKITLTT